MSRPFRTGRVASEWLFRVRLAETEETALSRPTLGLIRAREGDEERDADDAEAES